MRTRIVTASVVAIASSWLIVLPLAGGAATPDNEQIAHGKYLVEQVAKCDDCHSPHDAKGQVVVGKDLAGTKLDFQPIHPVPGWATAAPPIAGLPGLTPSQVTHLLTAGIREDGKPPAPPMPSYHMSRADAAAIVAYLKSLKPAGR